MPKQMSGKTFSNLLDYYIACLEQEDLLSVTFNVSSEGIQFFTPLLQFEMLFHTNNSEVTVELSDQVKRFFQTSLLPQKHKTLFYGYPVLIGPEGTISPVFFTELHHEQKEDAVVLSTHSPEFTLNHHVLSQIGYSSEEILTIRHDIEAEEFTIALASLCELFHVDPTMFSAELDQTPLKRTISFRLINKAIMYFGERTDITHNLIVELRQMKKKPLDDLASTSLLLLLTGEYRIRREGQTTKPLLEIFSLNPSQRDAVHHALTKALTVITGPPGTGKSQVVLNIIANAVYQNKTVLFASKNNKAVDVVVEKLNAILPDRLIIRMGNQAHRRKTRTELERFITHQFTSLTVPENTLTDLFDTTSTIEHLHEQLTTMMKLNEAIEVAQDTIDSCQGQLPTEVSNRGAQHQLDSIDLYTLQQDLTNTFQHHGLLRRFNPGKTQKKHEQCFQRYADLLPLPLKTLLQNTISAKHLPVETAVHWIASLKKIQLAREEITTITSKLLSLPSYPSVKNQLAEAHENHIRLSRPLFEQFWLHKLAEKTPEDKHCIMDYFSASEQLESYVGDQTVFKQLCTVQLRTLQQILAFLPVWVVTNLSAKHSFPLKNNLFDLLIIDEASQCDIVSALPLFYRAKHVVIIGDPHQLSHISLLTETQDRQLALSRTLSEDWFTDLSYTNHSLYDLAARIAHDHQEQPVLLNEHYRCHPDIISFSNDHYYDRKLTIATDEKRLLQHPSISTRILWCHVKGTTVHTKSPYNEEEAEKVTEEILKILGQTPKLSASVGVVTLFRAQTERIAEKLQMFTSVYDTEIVIGTAHRFQGDEKDIIVFSPAVSQNVKPGTLHWIQSTSQLLNVAVTRARSLFIIVGDHDVCLQTTGPLRHLAEYTDAKMQQRTGFDSACKQAFYEALQSAGIPVVAHYRIMGRIPTQIDFALFVNGSRYAILLDDEHQSVNQKFLRSEGWKIRRFTEYDLREKHEHVLEEINRFC
jgi:hypothetical protein